MTSLSHLNVRKVHCSVACQSFLPKTGKHAIAHINHILIIHSCIYRHFGCFTFLVIANDAAVTASLQDSAFNSFPPCLPLERDVKQRLAGGAEALPSMGPNQCTTFKWVGNQSPACRRQPTSINQQREVRCKWEASPLGSCLSWETSPCRLVIWTWLCPSVRAGATAQSPVRPSLHRTQRPPGKGISHVSQTVHTAEDLVPYQGPCSPGFAWSRAQQGSSRDWVGGSWLLRLSQR